jgi:hypothetical protein
MPEIQLRPKGQLTIPASIMQQNHWDTDTRFDVGMINGVLTLTPIPVKNDTENIMSYAGIFRGAWGDSPKAINRAISSLRDE